MTEMTYCKANETVGWTDVRVMNLDTGEYLRRCVEVDTVKGVATVYAEDGDGRVLLDLDQGIALQKIITGRFAIRRSA